jgi:hypothetical protein
MCIGTLQAHYDMRLHARLHENLDDGCGDRRSSFVSGMWFVILRIK